MMERCGFKLVMFLDDFCIVSDTKDKCQEGLATLITLLRRLGFSIAWDKVVSPTQRLVFLGIEIDSVHMTLSLPLQKVQNLKSLLSCFKSPHPGIMQTAPTAYWKIILGGVCRARG